MNPVRARPLNDPGIDARYGLEPVFEPGHDRRQRPLESAITIECPHCWQRYESSADLSLGTQDYIEDCEICCHSINISVRVNDDGFGAEVCARRVEDS